MRGEDEPGRDVDHPERELKRKTKREIGRENKEILVILKS